MIRLSGIIHPHVLQSHDVLGQKSLLEPSLKQETFHYMNFECVFVGGKIASNAKNSLAVFLDGFLFPHPKLKAQSDSKRVIEAYELWGESFITHVDGEFALALFDSEKGELSLYRDRLGKKNLFWSDQGDDWLFSTDLKGLLATGRVPATVSKVGFASFLFFGFIPQDLSALKGVNKLLPGQTLRINLQRELSIRQYWSLSALLGRKRKTEKDEVQNNFPLLFREAILKNMPQEGTVGLFVNSNSLGEKALFAEVEKLKDPKHIIAYVPSFEEACSGEEKPLPFIQEKVAITLEEVFKDLVSIVYNLDEPVANSSFLAFWFTAKKAKGNTQRLLVDTGWSEMFAGKKRYFSEMNDPPSMNFLHRLATLPKGFRNRWLMPFLRLLSVDARWKILRNVDINLEQLRYLSKIALFSESERKQISPSLFSTFNPEVFSQRFNRLSKVTGTLDLFLYFDAKTELPDRSLFEQQRCAESNGIKLSAPFLDLKLVEYLSQLNEEIRGSRTTPAPLLQEYLRNAKIDCFHTQEKSFVEVWRKRQEFRDLFAKLERGLLVEEGLIYPKWIRKELSYPFLIPQAFEQLFALLVLEIWFRLFINKPIGLTPLNISVDEFLK